MADLSTIARPYARALFDIARAAGNLAGWSDALAAAAAVSREPAAERFLSNPALDDQQRAAFVETIGQDLAGGQLLGSNEGKGLLRLLAENDRLAALPEIAAQFEALKAQAENKVKATLVSAAEVDAQIADQVANALERKLGRKVELKLAVDPDILGGAVIRAEDMVIDASVRTRLRELAAALVG
jgi:F-type H+-transporting ATPase subunit delta